MKFELPMRSGELATIDGAKWTEETLFELARRRIHEDCANAANSTVKALRDEGELIPADEYRLAGSDEPTDNAWNAAYRAKAASIEANPLAGRLGTGGRTAVRDLAYFKREVGKEILTKHWNASHGAKPTKAGEWSAAVDRALEQSKPFAKLVTDEAKRRLATHAASAELDIGELLSSG